MLSKITSSNLKKEKVYLFYEQKFIRSKKPYEAGLKFIFSQAAIGVRSSESFLMAAICSFLLTDPAILANKNKYRRYINYAEEAVTLFSELEQAKNFLKNTTRETPLYWPWFESAPSFAERQNIVRRAMEYIQADIEKVGLEGFLESQKTYMERDSRMHETRAGLITIPPNYVKERAVARGLYGYEVTKK